MIELFNKYGQIDLSAIDPKEVAKLSDEQQAALAFVVETVQTHEAARARLKAAQENVRELMRVESDAIEANRIANPTPTQLEALRAVQAAYSKQFTGGPHNV